MLFWKLKWRRKKVVLIKSPVRTCKFLPSRWAEISIFSPWDWKGPLSGVSPVSCTLYICTDMLSCNLSSPHIPLYTRIYMCSLSSWTSASDILASCPTFHHSINPLSEEYLAILILDVMWEVMERSWCHDWVTSPCFLQWQFLSLVVRRLWGMSAPAASHTPVINNINISPLRRPPASR